MSTISPGMRIEMRSVEWLVKRTQTTSSKLHLIEAVGISDIVKDKEIKFIQEYEKPGSVKPVNPADVTLVPDLSPQYMHTLLTLESQLRYTSPGTHQVSVGNRAAIDPLDFQLEPARLALREERPRLLIADGVGLGKTIEAGILVSELIARGRGRRILVVATKAMLTQFQQEFWIRFSIALTRMDSAAIQRIKARIPERHNPFHYFDRAIISIDTLKNSRRFGKAIEEASWDILVIDEAQNVAERKGDRGSSQRSRLARIMAPNTDALILLSATPHDGSKKSFASLMRLLSPLAIPDVEDYRPEDIKGLYVRRFRNSQEVRECLDKVIPERDVQCLEAQASPAEEKAFELLANLQLKADEGVRQTHRLFRIVLEKALFSSPAACAESLRQRIRRHRRQLEKGENVAAATHDIPELDDLLQATTQINRGDFSRYQRLLTYLQITKWRGQDSRDRLVIFTERISTMRWLKENLTLDLGLKENKVCTMSGEMSDHHLNKAKEDFGQGDSKVRLLIASDVAAEGLNLHFFCHRLVHFDLPWSLMTFEQRNGRIDRYGQEVQPQIIYLSTQCQQERIHNDFRILQILSRKQEQARLNIGDPAILVGTNVADEQGEYVSDAMEQGKRFTEVEADLDRKMEEDGKGEGEFSLMDLLLLDGTQVNPAGTAEPPEFGSGPQKVALFPSFFEFAVEALDHSKSAKNHRLRIHRQERVIELEDPDTMRNSVTGEPAWMPSEASGNDLVRLTDRKELAQESMERALAGTDRWPDTQYLWEMHPFAEWLGDQMQRLFNRKEVPVAKIDTLMSGESIFLFFGRVPSQGGGTLKDIWVGVRYIGLEWLEYMGFEQVVKLTGLHSGRHVNTGTTDTEALKGLVGDAVILAGNLFRKEVREMRDALEEKKAAHEAQLDQLIARHHERIEKVYATRRGIERVLSAQRDSDLKQVDAWKQQFNEWYERNRNIDQNVDPQVRLVAVLCG